MANAEMMRISIELAVIILEDEDTDDAKARRLALNLLLGVIDVAR